MTEESLGSTTPSRERKPFIFEEISPGVYRRNPKNVLRDTFPKTRQFAELFREYKKEITNKVFRFRTIQDYFERAIFRSLGVDMLLANLTGDEGRKMLVGEDVLQFLRSTYPLSRLVRRPFDFTYFSETSIPDALIFMDVGTPETPKHVVEDEVYISPESVQRGVSQPEFVRRVHRSFDRRRELPILGDWYRPQTQVLLVTPKGSALSEMEQQFADVRTFAPMPLTQSGWYEFVHGLRSGEIVPKARRRPNIASQ